MSGLIQRFRSGIEPNGERLPVSFAPLLDAAPAIPLHALAAMAAFVLGLVQFAAPKGTLPHRTIGWIWVLLMASVAISSFWIHTIRLVGPFSPIHLLSIFTLVMVPLAVWRAHTHRVGRPQAHHDHDVQRRAGHRRAVHLGARTDHARGGFRQLKRGPKADVWRVGPKRSKSRVGQGAAHPVSP